MSIGGEVCYITLPDMAVSIYHFLYNCMCSMYSSSLYMNCIYYVLCVFQLERDNNEHSWHSFLPCSVAVELKRSTSELIVG